MDRSGLNIPCCSLSFGIPLSAFGTSSCTLLALCSIASYATCLNWG